MTMAIGRNVPRRVTLLWGFLVVVGSAGLWDWMGRTFLVGVGRVGGWTLRAALPKGVALGLARRGALSLTPWIGGFLLRLLNTRALVIMRKIHHMTSIGMNMRCVVL